MEWAVWIAAIVCGIAGLLQIIREVKAWLAARSHRKKVDALGVSDPDSAQSAARGRRPLLTRLPATAAEVFGRTEELDALTEALEDRATGIVAVVGIGGIGKSALVNSWLVRLQEQGALETYRVFAWSFYSQGQRAYVVSGDQFIEAALRHFGDPDPKAGTPWEKGERLAELVESRPTILVLDGLEPLQSAAAGQEGRVQDAAVDPLLRALRWNGSGLCVISTRNDLSEFQPSDTAGPVRRIHLDRLSPAAGRELLHHRGVNGTDGELEAAVNEYEGHALSLVLLAEYLTVFLDGSADRRREVPRLLHGRTHESSHAFRVMEAYDRALGGRRRTLLARARRLIHVRPGRMSPEAAILRIIGLFDRPAAKPCLDALRAEPAISGVTDAVVGLSDDDWNHCLARLRRLRLVSPAPADADSLDAHPLVREYFGRKLQEESEEGFRQAHGRLYEYLRDQGKPTPDTAADTLEDLLPLYQAVHHGCRAGRHQEALDKIFAGRIRRGGDEHFSIHKLGAFGADLAALAAFFEERWSKPVAGLTDAAKRWVLNEVGYALRALGRLDEAVEPLRASIAASLAIGTPDEVRQAAVAAVNLADLLLAAGRLKEAGGAADEAVGLADRSAHTFERLATRAARAAAAHARGRLADARREFDEAERMQEDREPEHPLLYSFQGAEYCWLLLDLGRAEDVAERASTTLRWAEQHLRLLDIGLGHVSLGRASHLLVAGADAKESERLQSEARTHLDSGVDFLRRAGAQDYLAHGLLCRAAFHWDFRHSDFGDRDQAEGDLTEALTLAERHGFQLHETDACILQGHMALDGDPPDTEAAQKALDRARELVADTGYELRRADLLILEGRLLAKRGERDAGRAKLEEAITVAHREEDKGCIYQLAVDQANRYLKELEA